MALELSPFAYAVAASLLLLIEEVDMGYSIGDGVEDGVGWMTSC